MEASGPNAEQIEYWNKQAGPVWVNNAARMDEFLAPIGLAAIERAAPRAGERVIDVGCGNGQTSLQLAERVTPTGAVLGVDISTPMLERARERARAAGASHLRFENADAQTHSFPPPVFDLVFSRFGVMFFVDPAAAFTNLARALRPGGRVTFVCWQSPAQNPWLREPMMAIAQHVTMPPPAAPDAPGPFAFADAARVRGILERAGLSDVAFEPRTGEITLGKTVDEALQFSLEVGPVGAALRDAPASARAAASAAIRELLAARATPNGVALPYATWIATGKR
ncbi:MAG TPA: class I SAM-dependent methyltransferase [Myxococcota bacterium]|nr:class I SAM-dependent methyltransferase [Myxococcota bacterium]